MAFGYYSKKKKKKKNILISFVFLHGDDNQSLILHIINIIYFFSSFSHQR